MVLTKFCAATALALLSCAAMATTSVLDLSSGSGGFVSTPPSGGFRDTYTFTLPIAATFTGIVTSVVNGGQDVDFSSITLTGPSGLFSFAKLSSDPFEIWTMPTTSLLAAGSYSLTLLGLNSAAIGTYSGDVALSAVPAPVPVPMPEPESYALMLAGLGAIGLAVSRRRLSKSGQV